MSSDPAQRAELHELVLQLVVAALALGVLHFGELYHQ
jgi:hypothetical protein